MKRITDYDVVICGAGHAGVEAAYILDHYNIKTSLVTIDASSVGRMSCNPAIGGLAKGQIVKEIDLLGGIMPQATDYSALQYKMLNKSKGKSVWSPRAQVDKRVYESFIANTVSQLENVTLIEGEVVSVDIAGSKLKSVLLRDGSKIMCRAAILTCGTFLNGLIHVGQKKIRAGRMGESAAEGITEALKSYGFKSGRLKTGTPPRLEATSVRWENMSIAAGDDDPIPFSYNTTKFSPKNIACHTVYTSLECKKIIEDNLETSPMFSGDVSGVGPRYCPSIEDKIFRFKDHDTHMLYLEPEWYKSNQIYVNGFSTSLPEYIQIRALRSIDGLENVKLLRPGYAVEYDFLLPSQLKSTLETKDIGGLFFAGQINGTSGYEEAAAQGLMAGINAKNHIKEREGFTLGRDEAYIGVMIDDLITKDTDEPYRMFTSRAEYRILLRFSNTHTRLFNKSKKERLLKNKVQDNIQNVCDRHKKHKKLLDKKLKPSIINPILTSVSEKEISTKKTIREILKRPNVSIDMISDHMKINDNEDGLRHHHNELMIELEAEVKYEGYIKRQERHISKILKNETIKIPKGFNYTTIKSISNEGRDKLSTIKPETLGQAMRISGITPADISILSIMITR